MSDIYEVLLGTDPFNPDTDGDGFPDGVEVASGSDPLDPNCTPLNCKHRGSVESKSFSVADSSASASTPNEADSILFSILNSFGTVGAPHEADSVLFSVLNSVASIAQPHEAQSVPFSVVNANPTPRVYEVDSIMFSVVNNAQGVASLPPVRQGVQVAQFTKPRQAAPEITGNGTIDSGRSVLMGKEEQRIETDSCSLDTHGGGQPQGLALVTESKPIAASCNPDIRPSALIVGPSLDRSNSSTADQPAGRPRQLEKGEDHVVQVKPTRKRNGWILARFYSLFR